MATEVKVLGNLTGPGEEIEFERKSLARELREVPILSTLKDTDLDCLGELHLVRLHPGDVILSHGEISHFFWIVLAGNLEIFENMPDGREVVHFEYTRGSTTPDRPRGEPPRSCVKT